MNTDTPPTDPPITGMKNRIACWDMPPLLAAVHFVDCLMAIADIPPMRARFRVETGLSIEHLLTARSPIDRMIDPVTERDRLAVAAFADWVAENVWGLEMLCRRCKVQMKPGVAMGQTWVSFEDFGGDAGSLGATWSAGGPGSVIECWKCPRCGHSVTKGGGEWTTTGSPQL